MNKLLKSLTAIQVMAIVGGLCLSTTFLTAIYFSKQITRSDLFDLTPILLLLAVSIPAAIFSIVFVQLRAAGRTQATGHRGDVERQTNSSDAKSPRRSVTPKLDRPTTTKDPFENL